MDARQEFRDFLTTRRGRLTPADVGLPSDGRSRRVPGLRREEAARLAGISVEYYTRLERGNAAGVSDDVLDAISRGLRLNDAERSHLFDLARILSTTGATRRQPKQQRVRPLVQRIVDSMPDTPAYVRNARLDILAANRLGAALYAPLLTDRTEPANVARFIFLNPHADDFYLDWNIIANDAVAILRAEAGRDPYDKRLADLIGELSLRSDDFRVRWAAHNVKLGCDFTKRLHHPVVGDLTLTYEALDVTNDPGQRLLLYLAEPGSASADALSLLASWTSDVADRLAPHPENL